MFLGVRGGSATRFFEGLMAGDPVAWISQVNFFPGLSLFEDLTSLEEAVDSPSEEENVLVG